MKRKLLTVLAALFTVSGLWAAVGTDRKLEQSCSYFQPGRTAAASDFKIIIIGTHKDVEEHILLIAPDGKVTLIDCGIANSWPDLVRTFKKYNIKKIDQVIISHLHGDHIGGLPAILPMKEFEFKDIYWELLPDKDLMDEGELGLKNNKLRIQQVKDRAAARGAKLHEVKKGFVFDFGSGAKGRIVISAPPELKDHINMNNKSLVIRFEYGNFSMLFTGDMSYEQAAVLMKSGENIKCDVLKSAHHAGAYGTSTALLKAVAPKIAVSSMPEWLSKDPRGLEVDNLLHQENIPHFRSWEFEETQELVVATDGKEFFVTPNGLDK